MSNVKIFTNKVEPTALDQIQKLIEQPAFSDCKIRIMPDVHAGASCVIGFTANLGDKVIPNIVGVDIGCGMLTINLGRRDIDLEKLDSVIREYVPSGYNVHEGRITRFDRLQELYCYRNLKDTRRIERSIGTLGGGNHFIEVDVDSKGNKYLIIHTGSRNLGKQVCEYYQNLAYELMQGKEELFKCQSEIIEEYKRTGRRKEIQSAIEELHRNFKTKTPDIPKELAYLEGEYREQYLHDMKICQEYAEINRRYIMGIILNKLDDCKSKGSFETVHNYIDHDTNIVRKGAISAKKDEIVLIPLNMRDGCILAKGKGSNDWNQSAPHGAGRILSRNQAKETLSIEEFKDSMNGIFTTCISEATIDESPMAYKPIKDIIDNIGDTVEIIDILKPIYNFKAND